MAADIYHGIDILLNSKGVSGKRHNRRGFAAYDIVQINERPYSSDKQLKNEKGKKRKRKKERWQIWRLASAREGVYSNDVGTRGSNAEDPTILDAGEQWPGSSELDNQRECGSGPLTLNFPKKGHGSTDVKP